MNVSPCFGLLCRQASPLTVPRSGPPVNLAFARKITEIYAVQATLLLLHCDMQQYACFPAAPGFCRMAK
jgi:hypothetical protein